MSPTDSIVLHSKNLNIDKETSILKALNETDDPPSILEFSEDAENDFLILKLSQSLQADQHYKLKLHYAAELREEKLGFYRSYYMTASRKKKWIAVTYFKPNHARRAFPCFDELPYKAKFTLTLGVTLRHGSISNMPLLMSKKM